MLNRYALTIHQFAVEILAAASALHRKKLESRAFYSRTGGAKEPNEVSAVAARSYSSSFPALSDPLRCSSPGESPLPRLSFEQFFPLVVDRSLVPSKDRLLDLGGESSWDEISLILMAVGLDRHRLEDEGRRCARGGEACDIALAGLLITLHFSFGCSVWTSVISLC
ncbi:hypothetical protein BHM03_00010687 [Ensete ventricosum]|nr:hypothetical protein BHM03_00010687 [Ensete ventricosum]